MTDNKRVKRVVKWILSQGVFSTQEELGEKLGITSKSYLSQLINEENPKPDFINKLSSLDERININWLLTGEGEMLNHSNQQTGNGNNNQQGENISYTSTASLDKAIEEISEMRKALTEAMRCNQDALRANQSHTERLLSIIEKIHNV